MGRLTVTQMLYYAQEDGMEPLAMDLGFELALPGGGQAYRREFKVAHELLPIDRGWIKRAARLVIRHNKETFQANPEADTFKAIQGRKIEVFHLGKLLTVLGYGLDLSLAEVDPGEFSLRCPTGPAGCTLLLIPGGDDG